MWQTSSILPGSVTCIVLCPTLETYRRLHLLHFIFEVKTHHLCKFIKKERGMTTELEVKHSNLYSKSMFNMQPSRALLFATLKTIKVQHYGDGSAEVTCGKQGNIVARFFLIWDVLNGASIRTPRPEMTLERACLIGNRCAMSLNGVSVYVIPLIFPQSWCNHIRPLFPGLCNK